MLMPKPKKLTAEDEAVIARLKRSAARPLTKDEKDAQRVSWVYGNLLRRSKLSREEVADLLKTHDGA